MEGPGTCTTNELRLQVDAFIQVWTPTCKDDCSLLLQASDYFCLTRVDSWPMAHTTVAVPRHLEAPRHFAHAFGFHGPLGSRTSGL